MKASLTSHFAESAVHAAIAAIGSVETVFQRGGYDVPVRVELSGREWAGDEAGEWVPGLGAFTVSANVPHTDERGLPYASGPQAFYKGERYDPEPGEYELARELAATRMRDFMRPEYSPEHDPSLDPRLCGNVVDFDPSHGARKPAHVRCGDYGDAA